MKIFCVSFVQRIVYSGGGGGGGGGGGSGGIR